MQYCHECGERIPEDVKFCPECGADQRTEQRAQRREPVEESIAAARMEANTRSREPDKLEGGKRWYDRGWVVLVAFILFFPVGFYALYKNRRWGTGTKLAVGLFAFLVLTIAAGQGAVENPPPRAATSSEPQADSAQSEQTSSEPASEEPAPETQPEPQVPDLQLVSHSVERGEYGNAYIVGKIKNNTSSTYGYVQIQINLYQSEARQVQVGTAMANTTGLRPGTSWRFKASTISDDWGYYQIEDISAF